MLNLQRCKREKKTKTYSGFIYSGSMLCEASSRLELLYYINTFSLSCFNLNILINFN